jgi:hypothetical protein
MKNAILALLIAAALGSVFVYSSAMSATDQSAVPIYPNNPVP